MGPPNSFSNHFPSFCILFPLSNYFYLLSRVLKFIASAKSKDRWLIIGHLPLAISVQSAASSNYSLVAWTLGSQRGNAAKYASCRRSFAFSWPTKFRRACLST